MVENGQWFVSLDTLEQRVIDCLAKHIQSSEVLERIHKATNGTLDLSPLNNKKDEEKETRDVQLDKRSQKALSLIKNGANLFITGKAGTGKTFLLKIIKEELKKQKKVVAVVAPTGIAAKNAIGITIHSFLRLPTTPYFPGIENKELFALKPKDYEVVKSVDVIIIDEVSMVRCDVLDAADDVLRHYRHNDKPFGGVQMIFIGDLYQLMPVAPTEDWEDLRKYYKSPYFFCSKAYEALKCPMLELTKVHRQKDSDFIRLLNHVRDGKSQPSELKLLNTRYKANYKPSLYGGNIVLTTHNRKAKGINWTLLNKLDGEIKAYSASKSGWFPSDEYPTDYNLQLKVGARVMFVRNDTSEAAEYVNGTLGVVKEMGHSYIVVETDEKQRIYVTQQRWEHQQYRLNKVTKRLETEVTGSFSQFPLKLAWAVTIHKSQGMTFDRVTIDAEKAFTYGQVYVALSRCRSLGGITLMTELSSKTIKADEVVKQFLTSVRKIEVEDAEVEADNRHLMFSRPEERTLFLVNNRMSIDEIVERCNEKKGIIYSHLAKLTAEGKVDAKDYVDKDIFASLHNLFIKYDTDADRREIKEMCPSANYGEIELVRAYVIHQLGESGKNKSKPKVHPSEAEITSAVYERDVKAKMMSKWLYNNECRIVCDDKGVFYVYISNTQFFVKIKSSKGPASGSIFVKRPDSHGWATIVHAVSSKESYTIGYIKKSGGGLMFKPDSNKMPFLIK